MGERRNNCNQAKGVDTSVKKWLVVIVAGQSNAVGYDESTPVESEFPENPRICQLGLEGDDNLKIIPLRWCAQNFQNMSTCGVKKNGTKGVHYPLGQELLKWIPSDYGVLFLPVAFGNTPVVFKSSTYWNNSRQNFNENTMMSTSSRANTAWKNWAWQCISNAEAEPLVGLQATNPIKIIQRRLAYVLKTYPESALLALVWVQGEASMVGDSNAGVTNQATFLYGYTRMFMGIQAVCKLSGIKNIVGNDITHSDIFTFRAPIYWSSSDSAQAPNYIALQELYKKMLPKNNYITPPQTDSVTNKYNGAPSGPKNAQGKPTLGPGQTSTEQETHYGNNAFRDYIAPMLSDAIKKHYDSLNAKYFTIKNQHELITDYLVG